MPWLAMIFFNHFKSDLDGVKSKVGFCFTRIQSNELRNPIYQTKFHQTISTEPNIPNQIHSIKHTKLNPMNQFYQTKSNLTGLSYFMQQFLMKWNKVQVPVWAQLGPVQSQLVLIICRWKGKYCQAELSRNGKISQ